MPKYKTQPMKVDKTPFWNKYKDKTPPAARLKYKKGDFIGAQKTGYEGADINKAPGYSKLKGKLKKKGLQTNYSK